MRTLGASVLLALVVALPPSALADDSAAAPQFTCAYRALRVMAAEMSGLRVECSISGAPAAEQQFSIELNQAPADVAELDAPPLGARSVCSGPLSGGAGSCIGTVFNADSPAFGYARVSALL